MVITTNNVPRDLISGYKLTDEERKEFDYIEFDANGDSDVRFFRYKSNVYDTKDCEIPYHNAVSDLLPGWDGYYSQTFFSGVVFKYAPDTDYEQVIVGRYCT